MDLSTDLMPRGGVTVWSHVATPGGPVCLKPFLIIEQWVDSLFTMEEGKGKEEEEEKGKKNGKNKTE